MQHRHDTCGVGDRCLGHEAVVQVLCGEGSKQKIRGLEVALATRHVKQRNICREVCKVVNLVQ
jgi:hypothetical protein